MFASLILMALLAITILANPVPSTDLATIHSLDARYHPTVFWCTLINWTGICTRETNPLICHDWREGDHSYNSFGPDPGLSCNLYLETGCDDKSSAGHVARDIEWPGIIEIDNDPRVMKQNFVTPCSWKCTLKTK